MLYPLEVLLLIHAVAQVQERFTHFKVLQKKMNLAGKERKAKSLNSRRFKAPLPHQPTVVEEQIPKEFMEGHSLIFFLTATGSFASGMTSWICFASVLVRTSQGV